MNLLHTYFKSYAFGMNLKYICYIYIYPQGFGILRSSINILIKKILVVFFLSLDVESLSHDQVPRCSSVQMTFSTFEGHLGLTNSLSVNYWYSTGSPRHLTPSGAGDPLTVVLHYSHFAYVDKLVWDNHQKGTFTVKSTY